MKFTADDFYDLERRLISQGADSDLDDFATIKKRLETGTNFDPDEFARQAIYVVLASGFSQKTAKRKHAEIMAELHSDKDASYSALINIFHNQNKISAIIKIWQNRRKFRDEYYKQNSLVEKLCYLATMPHIGKITANHLARNLGENVFKKDVWITKLLDQYGNDLFIRLAADTNLPQGYIDVVLWKSCQIGLLVPDSLSKHPLPPFILDA